MELYNEIILIDNISQRKSYIDNIFENIQTTLEQIKYLIDSDLNIDINHAFINVCKSNDPNLDKIIYLINHDADINHWSGSSLIIAMHRDNQILVKFLLDNDIVLTDGIFETAITSNYIDIIKRMIDIGFKINKNHIDCAVRCERHDILQIFIDDGVSSNDICESYLKNIIASKCYLTNKMLLVLSKNHTDFNYVINKLNKIT